MANVIIIGSGPAGISASLYTARAGIETTIISTGHSALEKADKIQNYYGFREAVSGKELAQAGVEGAKKVGVQFITDEVVGIGFQDKLVVETTHGNYPADSIILATGTARKSPEIKGIRKFEGKGVSYCAVCDAFFYRGKDAYVLGNGEFALHEIQALLPVAASVTLLTNGEEVKVELPKEVRVKAEKVAAVEGEEFVSSILLETGEVLPACGIFIAYGIAGSTALAKKIGAGIEGNKVVVNENMATNIPGLFAAGDCTGGLLQISKAVYEGAKAGTEVIKQLRKKEE